MSYTTDMLEEALRESKELFEEAKASAEEHVGTDKATVNAYMVGYTKEWVERVLPIVLRQALDEIKRLENTT